MKLGQCKGCYRTLEEIGAWRMAGPDEQIEILKAIAQRFLADERPGVGDRRERLRHRLVMAGVIDDADESA